MKTDVTVFNFSGIYDEESFYQSDKGSSFYCEVLDLKGIPGTNYMCDDGAKKEIARIILEHAKKKYPDIDMDDRPRDEEILSELAKGIHFIDSGNYHYMSALLLDMVKEPFSLIVLDHHPDMQPSMFGQILSCGGWVKEVLDTNSFVRDIHVIGADKSLIESLDENDREKVHFYSKDDVVQKVTYENSTDVDNKEFAILIPETEYPVYLSIDKDVMTKAELETNWDQGEFSASEVLEFTKALLNKKKVIGVDICGECALDQEGIDIQRAIEDNDRFNSDILAVLRNNNISGL